MITSNRTQRREKKEKEKNSLVDIVADSLQHTVNFVQI